MASTQKTPIAPETWDVLYREYVEGKGQLPFLAEKHGVNVKTVQHRARHARWGRDRRLYGEKLRTPQTGASLSLWAAPALPNQLPPTLPEMYAEAFGRYQGHITALDRIAVDLETDCAEAVTQADKALATSSLCSVLERLRIMLRIPLSAPARHQEKPARRRDIVPFEACPAEPAASPMPLDCPEEVGDTGVLTTG